MHELPVYAFLFATAFGAASVLPVASEPLLVGLVLQDLSLVGLWLTASVGNTGGSVLNWWLGRAALHWQDRRWFPVKPTQRERAMAWFQRYGTWTLMLAWLPVIGDALTVAAGLLRVRLALFVLLVGIGKGLRYAFVIWATLTVGR